MLVDPRQVLLLQAEASALMVNPIYDDTPMPKPVPQESAKGNGYLQVEPSVD